MRTLLTILSFTLFATYCMAQVPDTSQVKEMRRLAEKMKGMKTADILKYKDSLMKATNNMAAKTNKQAAKVLDSLSPGTKKENKALLNTVMKRRYDTTYTIVDFIYKVTQKDRYNNETTMVSGSTDKAVVYNSGTSMMVQVQSKNPQMQSLMNDRVRMRIMKQETANNLFSLHGTGVYNKNFLFDGHSIKEAGSEITIDEGINFFFQHDETQNYSAVGVGASIKTKGQERLAEGAETTTFTDTKKSGVGGSTDLHQAKISGLSSNNIDSSKPAANIVKTPTGFKISYSFTKKESNGDDQSTFTEELTATIGSYLQPYEAIIQPVEAGTFSYRKWLPKGPKVDGSDDTKGDDSLKFKVIVRNRHDTTKLYPGNYTVAWALNDVTKYPGFCNNYPAYTESPNTDDDLSFNKNMASDANFDAATTNASVATTKENKGKNAVVNITCMDYAAWGKLSATVTLDDGSLAITARPFYSKEISFLTIPFDEDENKLADYWEKANKLTSHPLTWDEDNQPANQRDKGDGFTLLEEYRGFAVYNVTNKNLPDYVYERTDPNHKDAFVYDKDQLFLKYYERENPSNLHWHYVSAGKQQIKYNDDPLTPLNRWVNFNKTDEGFYAEQYALLLTSSNRQYAYAPKMTAVSFTANEWKYAQEAEAGKVSDETEANYALEDNGTKDIFTSPMKTHVKVEILVPRITAKCSYIIDLLAYQQAWENQMAMVVKHEIGHCLGIRHHKPLDDCGAENCVMRYFTNPQRNDANWLRKSIVQYCKKGDQGPGYTHVQKSDPGPNDEPYDSSPTGSSTGDNCYGQITVKSNPNQ